MQIAYSDGMCRVATGPRIASILHRLLLVFVCNAINAQNHSLTHLRKLLCHAIACAVHIRDWKNDQPPPDLPARHDGAGAGVSSAGGVVQSFA